MIQDASVLAEIRLSWQGVAELRGKLQRGILASFAFSRLPQPFLADAAYNLPLLHAFAVLNDVLHQLRDEGHFKCPKFFLGALVDASSTVLPWVDLPTIRKGVAKRNDVAHRGIVLPRAECWQYIDTIQAQLLAWSVIP